MYFKSVVFFENLLKMEKTTKQKCEDLSTSHPQPPQRIMTKKKNQMREKCKCKKRGFGFPPRVATVYIIFLFISLGIISPLIGKINTSCLFLKRWRTRRINKCSKISLFDFIISYILKFTLLANIWYSFFVVGDPFR